MYDITMQPGQPGNGMDYDPRQPLPYGIHVDRDTLECQNVPGCPGSFRRDENGTYPKLIGFQQTEQADPTGLVLAEDWLDDPEQAVGMFPVFIEAEGMFNITVPITGVTVR